MEHLVKINLPGGFISAGDLYEILLIAEAAGATNIRFGNRQQLYFTVNGSAVEDMELDMLKAELDYDIDSDEYQNITSSYVADTIFNHEGWLREGVYKDILDRFEYQPKLKINLVDSQQTFVPFFSGNINFIASGISNYWHIYIRFPKTGKSYCCPSLVYSEDLPSVAKLAEDIILRNKKLFYDNKEVDGAQFYKMLVARGGASFDHAPETLNLPDFQLPYYEGFNKYNNKYWLGVYRRNELFPLAFLKDLCLLCLNSRIGQVYTTPWKSIIIKGIEQADRAQWGALLSKYRLNVRHAANELNWQIEDICDEGLALKQQLVREFEEADVRTYQLSFAIKTQPKTGLQGAIIIKKCKNQLFEILHTANFNPNSRDYISYLKNLKAADLGAQLITLCNLFYDRQSTVVFKYATVDAIETDKSLQQADIYECSHCLTRYDKVYGDAMNDIEKDIAFELLEDYCCPVCDAPKSEFILVAVA